MQSPEAAGRIHLSSKLEPPRAFGALLDRPKLFALLDRKGARRITLINAPAGFGKTTTLRRAYLDRPAAMTAWLTLDAADNDPGQLLHQLLRALGEIDATERKDVSGLDNISTSADLRTRLTEALHGLPEGYSIFLDDLEELTSPTALAVVSMIMRVLPDGCHLFMCSRTHPNLPLGRYRMRGQLQLIGAEDLRFSLSEVDAVLRREVASPPLSRDTVERVFAATEGWIGSIQMAVLSLRSTENKEGFLRNFDGSNADLAEYLAEDLLEGLSPDMRDFLLATSVFELFSAALCDDVLGRTDSAALLKELARANMFLFSYEQDASWFRYHNLFRSFLLQRAEETGVAIADLRRRASQWYGDRNQPSKAISYALAADDPALAAEMIDRAAMDFFHAGRLQTITHWVGALPAATRDGYPRIMVAYAWSLLALHKSPETVQHLIASLQGRNDLSRDLRNEVAYLGPYHMALHDRLDGLDDVCVAAIGRDQGVSSFVKGVLWNIASYARLHRQDFEGAVEAARLARRAHTESASSYGLGYAESFIGRIELAQGRLQSARVKSDTARAIADQGEGGTAPLVAAVSLRLRLDFETGNDRAVEAAVAEYGDLIRQLAVPAEKIELYVIQAELAAERGDSTEAYRLLNQLRQLGRAQGHPRMIAVAWAEQARLAARRGDIAAARDYLERAREYPEFQRYEPAFLAECEATMEMIAGNARNASSILHAAETGDRETDDIMSLTRLRVLLIELDLLTGHGAVAEELIPEVLELVRREGLVRPILRAPDPVRRAFVRHAVAGNVPLRQEIVEHLDPSGSPEGHALDRRGLPLEPLSRRERDVLEELARGFSNQNISDALCISLATVKTHLRNINAKLMATNRTEAVATARRLGLVSDT